MKAVSAAFSLVAAATLGGCAITGTIAEPEQANPIAGWYAETRDVAEDAWLYAQLSTNAYDDHEAFILPGDIVLRHMEPNDGRGYAYAIYDRFEGQELAETIIAYRGTEPAANDWILGNFLGLQNNRGYETARSVASELDGADLSVTGHSLGGAIAHYVSLNPLYVDGEEIDQSVVFNNSPRFSGYARTANRIAVVERGDWLTPLRFFGSEPNQIYQSLNCRPGFSPFDDHSIRSLAECLTWIAAYEDEAAQVSMAQNPLIDQPESQADPQRPPQAELRASGVLINPYVDHLALRTALHESLLRSTVLEPHYAGRSGLRVEVRWDEEAEAAHTLWVLNGVEQARESIECPATRINDCADAIVAFGADLLPRISMQRRGAPR